MFSIARYTGDEDEKDTRTLEKKQERLNKLNARIANKKRKEESTDDTPVEKKRKNSELEKVLVKEKIVEKVEEKKVTEKKSTKVQKKKKEEPVTEAEVVDMEEVETEEVEAEEEVETEQVETEEAETKEEEDVEVVEEEEEEAMEVVEEDVPTLEAFPDMLGPKKKQSKEDAKLLKSMGIPEWMLQPTVVSPKESCGLDEAGLSEHIIQRCKDLGLSSLFAGKIIIKKVRHSY